MTQSTLRQDSRSSSLGRAIREGFPGEVTSQLSSGEKWKKYSLTPKSMGSEANQAGFKSHLPLVTVYINLSKVQSLHASVFLSEKQRCS